MIEYQELVRHQGHHLIVITYKFKNFEIAVIKCQECGKEITKCVR